MVSHEQLNVRRVEAPGRVWPGYAMGLAAALLLISARTTTPVLFGLLVIWAFLVRDQLRSLAPPIDGVAACLTAFLGYALLSSLWAASTLKGLSEGAIAAAIAATSLVLLQLIQREDRTSLLRLGRGLTIGFACGLAYFLLEVSSGQAIKIWLYNSLHLSAALMEPDQNHRWAHGKLVAISSATLSRNVAPMTPLLWPALMTVLGSWPGPKGRYAAGALLVFACLVIFVSPHETSKVAVVAAALIFSLATWRREWAYNAVKAAWIAACLCIVPMAVLAHKLDLQNAPWLQKSAQHRIVIWNFTARQVIKAPFFGSGIYTTYVRGPEISAKAETKSGARFKEGMSRHAHNVFLQTWFELGLAGTCLLLALGWAILRKFRDLSASVQPFALAAFMSSMALMSSSYGMWQDWFLSLFALTPVLFTIGARVLDTAPDEADRAS